MASSKYRLSREVEDNNDFQRLDGNPSSGVDLNSNFKRPIKNGQEDDLDNEFQCGECQIIFLVKEHLKNHLRSNHFKPRDKARDDSLATEQSESQQIMHLEEVKQEKFPPEDNLQNELMVQEELLEDGSLHKPFLCSECDKSFKSKFLLKRHFEAVHRKIMKYFCPICKAGFYFKANQENHTKNVHRNIEVPEQGVESSIIDVSREETDLQNIITMETETKESTPNEEMKVDLKQEEMGLYESQPKSYRCGECGKYFNRNSFLKRHVDTVHSKIKRFFCPICKTGFYSKTVQEKHTKNIHRNVVSTKDEPEWTSIDELSGLEEIKQELPKEELPKHVRSRGASPAQILCQECGKTFGSASILRRHIDNIHTHVKCICSYCKKTFTAKEYLDKHIKRIHLQEREFNCKVCQIVFTKKEHLKNHNQLKHAEMKNVDEGSVLDDDGGEQKQDEQKQDRFLCDTCGKDFATKVILGRHHLYVHLKVRDVKCPLCPKTFTVKYFLRKHLATADHGKRETDSRNLCQNCGQIFASVDDLKIHVKDFHRDAARFLCEICDKGFSKKRHLIAHLKNGHSEVLNNYSCKYCELGFLKKQQLIIHVQTEHKDKREYRRRKSTKQLASPQQSQEEAGGDSSDSTSHNSPEDNFQLSDSTTGASPQTISIKTKKPKSGTIYNEPCEYCGKIFRRSDHLKTHVDDVHLRKRKFSCTVCEKIFSRKRVRDYHVVLVHNQIMGQPDSVVETFMKYSK